MSEMRRLLLLAVIQRIARMDGYRRRLHGLIQTLLEHGTLQGCMSLMLLLLQAEMLGVRQERVADGRRRCISTVAAGVVAAAAGNDGASKGEQRGWWAGVVVFVIVVVSAADVRIRKQINRSLGMLGCCFR